MDVRTTLYGVVNLNISNSAKLNLYATGNTQGAVKGTYQFFGSVILQTSGVVQVFSDPTVIPAQGINILAISLTVYSQSSIIGSGNGYPSSSGPGAGYGTSAWTFSH